MLLYVKIKNSHQFLLVFYRLIKNGNGFAFTCVVGLSNTPDSDSRLVSSKQGDGKNEKLDLTFGRVSRNLEKGWVSFWQETDKLGKR